MKISAERVLQWLLEKVEAGAGSVDVGGHLHNTYQWSERRKEHEIVLHLRKNMPQGKHAFQHYQSGFFNNINNPYSKRCLCD